MDPTTADFNAWLAEEGAKVGATVLPQGPPDNFLRGYGQGYQVDLGTDSAYDPTTADILAKAQEGGAFPNWLRKTAGAIPENKDLPAPQFPFDPRSMSAHNMVRGSLNTVANWLDKKPEIGPDTIAPLGLAPMGMALTPRNAVGAMGGKAASGLPMDEAARLARARAAGFDTDRTLYHGTSNAFDEFGPGDIYLTDKPKIANYYADARAEQAAAGHVDPANAGPNVLPLYAKAKHPLVVSDKGPDGTHGWAKDNLEAALGMKASRRSDLIEEARRRGYDMVELKDILDIGGPQSQFIPLDAKTVRSKFAAFDPALSDKAGLLLSDQSKASLPGTLINAMDLEKAKAAGSDASKPTYRDHALAQGKEDLWGQSQISGMSEFADRMITNPDDWRRRIDAGFDFLADKSPSKYLNADNAKASLPGTVINSVDAAGPRDTAAAAALPARTGKYGSRAEDAGLRKVLGQMYEQAVKGDDLSSQFDILNGRLNNDRSMPQPMRERMEMEVQRVADELGDDWLKKYAPDWYAANDSSTRQQAKAPGAEPSITAYHGSPHDFDRFDMSKIGTGEGAQAYGHGLYFAEREGVAKEYKDKLAGNPVVGGQDAFADMPWLNSNTKGVAQHALTVAQQYGLHGDDAVRRAIQDITDAVTPGMESATRQAHYDAVNALGPLLGKQWDRNPGRMYEVRIKADPEQFLDWDKPLSQQSEAVRKALKAQADALQADPSSGPRRAGKHIAQHRFEIDAPASETLLSMGDSLGGRDKISAALRDAGIPGIKYLDQGSRVIDHTVALEQIAYRRKQMADPNITPEKRKSLEETIAGLETRMKEREKPTRNFVVFDADKIEILKKYGWVPAGMVGGGMVMTPPDEGSSLPKEVQQ